MKKLLTVRQVAEMLKVHVNTIYRMVKEGIIPHMRFKEVGIRFSEDEVIDWMEKGSVKPLSVSELFPKFDISLDGYDRILLKRRTELKSQTRWTYGIGSVILRKTKNKEERYYIHYQVDGHRIRKALKGVRTRAEAVKILNSEVVDMFRGKCYFSKKVVTFNEMGNLFLAKYSKPKKRSWKSADRVYIRNMKPFFADMKLTKITPLKIEDYITERLKNGKGRRVDEKVSNSTVNRELQCLRKIFNKAIDWGYAVDNPVKKVEFLSERGSIRKRVLSEDEEVRFLAVALQHIGYMTLISLHTGMRKGEVLKLKWENVDFEAQEITIVETKDDEDRVVPMNPFLFNLLFTLKSQDGKSEYVFMNPRTGTHYVEIKRGFTSGLKKAGIQDFHFHDLRHTYASRLVRNGVDLNTVKELLGHSSITTTQRYLHSQAEQKREAVNSLDRQNYKHGLQWQMSDKTATMAIKPDSVSPSYLRS